MADPQKIIFGTASCEDLVQCIMNLGDLELSVLKSLMRKGQLRNEDLAKEHKRDKSIVHRALQRLISCGLVFREKKTITKGGYFYVYTSIDREQIRSKMMDCVDRMYKNMSKLVDEFDIDLKGKK